jgi:hypothetical protein
MSSGLRGRCLVRDHQYLPLLTRWITPCSHQCPNNRKHCVFFNPTIRYLKAFKSHLSHFSPVLGAWGNLGYPSPWDSVEMSQVGPAQCTIVYRITAVSHCYSDMKKDLPEVSRLSRLSGDNCEVKQKILFQEPSQDLHGISVCWPSSILGS